MSKVYKNFEPLLDNSVRSLSLQVGYNPNPARVVLMLRRIKPSLTDLFEIGYLPQFSHLVTAHAPDVPVDGNR